MRNVSASCRSHPWITAVAAFVGFWVGLHFFLEWRSERAWQRYAAEARARGVKLTLVELAPPEIPPEENFAELPMLKAPANASQVMMLPPPAVKTRARRFGDPFTGERIDWTIWQLDFRRADYVTDLTRDPIRDTLRGLKHYAPQFEQWWQWRSRPRCSFAQDLRATIYESPPYLGTIRYTATLFHLRMHAHLALRDSAAAYEDFRDGFQACLALREEPTYQAGITRTLTVSQLVSPVGEGLKDRAWTAADLRRIEEDLSQFDSRQSFRRALAYARAAHNTIFDELLASPASRAAVIYKYRILPFQGKARAFWQSLIPNRIFRDNQLQQNRYVDEVLASVSASDEEYDLDRPTPSSPHQIRGRFEEFYSYTTRNLGSYDSMRRLHIQAKSQVDLARIACALERFRQERGAFPAALEELTPEFLGKLPIDAYSKKPYRYERTAEGSFRLYSVGEDRIDNGGVIDRQRTESNQVDDIWFYAPPVVAP